VQLLSLFYHCNVNYINVNVPLAMLHHRDYGMHTKITNVNWQSIACTRSLDIGLISAKGQKLGCFK